MSGSHKVVVPPTPVSSAHLWLGMLVVRGDRKVGEEQITDSDGEVRMDASCITKGELRRAQDLFWAYRARWWQHEKLKLLDPCHLSRWLLHMCLVIISMVLFHNGIQRMTINSIPKELLLRYPVMWHVVSWLISIPMMKCWNITE